jgi:hypothetical protein
VLAMGNATVESAALVQGLARFFYAANPADTSYPDHKHVPDFFVKVSTINSAQFRPHKIYFFRFKYKILLLKFDYFFASVCFKFLELLSQMEKFNFRGRK